MKRIVSIFALLGCIYLTHAKSIPFVLKQATELIKNNHHEQAYTALNESIMHCKTTKEKVDIANTLLQLGIHYFDHHKSAHALKTFNTILGISDRFSVAHHNIGFLYTERLGIFDKAIEAFEKALALKADNAATHFCYAIALLSHGDLAKGFREYEWRWQRGERSPRNFAAYPLEKQWRGEPLAGKTIFLRAEQGMGDTLHFIRYAELLYWMGAQVIAEAQDALLPLLSLCPYIHKAISIHAPMPNFDYQIPYLSIPTVVNTTLETIPSNVPYLFTNSELEQEWHTYFKDKRNTFNVGICWRGDGAHTDDKFMPLHHFAELAKIKGIQLFSLQKQNNDEDVILFPLHIFDDTFDTTHGSFMDTAAIMRQLDLIITVDTSVAHLAGGLGVPVWVPLPFPAEWRWLTDRNDSPWYPTMKLFRQTKRNNWKSVIKQIKQEVTQLICKK